jgi:signal transduction histidine kinase
MRWVLANAEYLVLGASLATIAALVGWWAVFAQRMILGVHALTIDQIDHTLTGSAKDIAMVAADEHTWRQTEMILGESSVFGAALIASVIVLFLLVRRARDARDRMERLLQFTSHEIKTPIAGVRTLLQSLRRGSIPKEREGPFLDQGLAACDRLEHLTETILAYQRTVVRSAQVESFAALNLLEDVLGHRARSIPDENLGIELGEAASVLADRDAFRVILENLLDNAKKYGGPEIQLRTRTDPSRWIVEVADSGEGFEPSEAERLFEPFERNNTHTHGSGLGLYISRQLARQMGGELVAASEGPGRGATFVLSLRRAEG